MNPIIRAVEPKACPSLTKGVYEYDYGDTAGILHAPDAIHALAQATDLVLISKLLCAQVEPLLGPEKRA